MLLKYLSAKHLAPTRLPPNRLPCTSGYRSPAGLAAIILGAALVCALALGGTAALAPLSAAAQTTEKRTNPLKTALAGGATTVGFTLGSPKDVDLQILADTGVDYLFFEMTPTGIEWTKWIGLLHPLRYNRFSNSLQPLLRFGPLPPYIRETGSLYLREADKDLHT